jgi:hypothetical protein
MRNRKLQVHQDLETEIRPFTGNSVVPIQSLREFCGGKFQVNHSTTFRDGTRRRSMKQPRAHDYCSTSGHGAGYRIFPLRASNLLCGESPFTMRTGNYARWPGINSAFVQMEPDCENGPRIQPCRLRARRLRTRSVKYEALLEFHLQGQAGLTNSPFPGALPFRLMSLSEG